MYRQITTAVTCLRSVHVLPRRCSQRRPIVAPQTATIPVSHAGKCMKQASHILFRPMLRNMRFTHSTTAGMADPGVQQEPKFFPCLTDHFRWKISFSMGGSSFPSNTDSDSDSYFLKVVARRLKIAVLCGKTYTENKHDPLKRIATIHQRHTQTHTQTHNRSISRTITTVD